MVGPTALNHAHRLGYPYRIDGANIAIHNRKDRNMTTHTALTAPTQFAEAKGIRFAYRRFGRKAGLPLIFNQHFTGNLDNWDPAVLDGLANEREVITFNNAGVASSTGEVPKNIPGMAT